MQQIKYVEKEEGENWFSFESRVNALLFKGWKLLNAYGTRGGNSHEAHYVALYRD